MPPLSHAEPLIPEHSAQQRLRSDTIDLACSAGSSSFLGRLWPNRRKFASPYKSFSVGAAQEICESSSTPSNFTDCKNQWSRNLLNRVNYDDVHCNGESPTEDCADGQLRRADGLQVLNRKLGLHGKRSQSKEVFPEWIDLEGSNVECRNAECTGSPISSAVVEVNTERRGEGSEGRSQPERVCVTPIMESLKGVVINKQRFHNINGAPHAVYGKQEDGKGIESSKGVSGAKKEGNPKEGIDQTLMKRLASCKSGELNGIKKMRMSTLCELQRVAATLQRGSSLEEQWLAADELRRLCKDDPIARVTLGVQLGAIPPLVSLLHSLHHKHQCTALLALLNLAAGNDLNKGAIVKANAVPRMVGLLHRTHAELQMATVSLFLSLSALDGNKAEIGTSGAVAVLVSLMQAPHMKKDALRTLYNLSICTDNAKFIVEAGGVHILLGMVSDIDMVDKSLAILGNLVQTDIGRHKFTDGKVSYSVLVEAMLCVEMPKCQERAVYVLMMIAHHSQWQCEAMVAAGIIPALVELSLLGSPLAQKRATRTLDSFRRAKAVSAPQQREYVPLVADSTDDSQQSTAKQISGKKVVDGLVRQSLNRTMHRIARRAHLSTILGDSAGGSESSASETTTMWSFRRPVERRSSSCSITY